MGIKKYRPTSPARRYYATSDFAEVTKSTPEKSLLDKQTSTGGRNNLGRITCRFRGGGHKQRYRIIDFRRRKIGVPAKVAAIEYDPNRSARIALLHYADGEKSYILAPDGLTVGDQVISSMKADIQPGNSMRLRHIPPGTTIHNIELRKGKGGQLVRSAGTSAQLLAKEGDQYAIVRLPSGEERFIRQDCMATIGQVGNVEHGNVKLGKAGRKRYLGIRPAVRGSAMNPNDHPHGGGEGRSPIGMAGPKTPWGQPAQGKRTRRNKSTDKYIFRRRSKKRR